MQEKISSGGTFFYKRVFPIVWFAFLAIFVAVGLFAQDGKGGGPPLPFLVVPVIMMVIGFAVMKKLVFDLVDEVIDAGDALIVRNRGEEDRIALADIKNVSYSSMSNPPRVTLSLRQPGKFGSDVTFCAPLRVLPFPTKNQAIEKLIDRVDAARQRAGRK